MRLESLRVVILATVVSVGLLLPALPAGASSVGDDGCTPAYWRNHTDNWLENDFGARSYDASDLFSEVFGVDHGDTTLIETLYGNGGPGLPGAKRILARAATAALLNAAHDDLAYPLIRHNQTAAGPAIVEGVQDAWDSGDRDTILDLAALFDDLNGLGCPLD